LLYLSSCLLRLFVIVFLSSVLSLYFFFFFFSSRRRHTRFSPDWSSDVCSSDLPVPSFTAASIATMWCLTAWTRRCKFLKPTYACLANPKATPAAAWAWRWPMTTLSTRHASAPERQRPALNRAAPLSDTAPYVDPATEPHLVHDPVFLPYL